MHLFHSFTQGPAARYMKNIELKDEVDRTSRTVESQERQIEALQSLNGKTDNPTLLRKSKVGAS